MFKTTFAAGALALATVFAGTLPTYAADAQMSAPVADVTMVASSPRGKYTQDGALFLPVVTAATVTAASPLSEAETDALLFMREEEKLAHDVYVTLYAQWGARVFTNIAASEQTHTDAVATLLDRYGLSDPTEGNAVGEFTDPALQSLYDQLIEQGDVSLANAFKVGAAIEEIDILDLEQRIAETDHADIQLVYARLLAGSANHLRAFTSTLERQTGESYTPQYMEQAEYDAIIAAGGNGQQGGRRGGRH